MAPVEKSVPKQEAPRPLNIEAPKFTVVTVNNIEQIRTKLENGSIVLFAIDDRGYKTLLKNNAEYKRYIEQQKASIVFYESNLNVR
jgi:hypothetical protein